MVPRRVKLAVLVAWCAGAPTLAQPPLGRPPSMQGSGDRPEAGGYPAVRHGGNHMIDYYFPPYTASTPWAPDWSPEVKMDRHRDERLDLEGRSGYRRRDPGWRSQKERDHVFAQFAEAKRVYERLAGEAARIP